MSKKELEETENIRTELDQVNTSDAEAPKTANVARRRALIAGLAAAPVVLSLMNRSAWAAPTVSCNLVASYVSAGNKWQSPRPANNNGTLTISQENIEKCSNPLGR